MDLPALGRRGRRARARHAEMGATEQAARLQDAAGRHSPDPAFDRFADVSVVIASKAKQSRSRTGNLDCFVATLLAMTAISRAASPPAQGLQSPSRAAAAAAGFHAGPSRTARRCRRWRG